LDIIVADLHGVDHAEGVALKAQHNLKDSGAQALHRFADVRLPSFRRDCQCRKADELRTLRKPSECIERGFQP